MYKRKSISKLGRKTSHRHLMVRNLLTSLIKSGYVTTTTSRAKVMRQEFGALLTIAKKGESLANIRQLTSKFNDEEIARKLFDYAKAAETGVELVKVGFRPGDNTEKTKISLIGFQAKKKVVKATKEEKKEIKVEKKDASLVKQTRKTDFSKTIKDTFTGGRTERTRTRSGL